MTNVVNAPATDPEQAPQQGGTVPISQVPPSPGMSNKLTTVTNTTQEDFETSWDGETYFLKAGDTQAYPEWLARHIATSLAKREVFARKRDVDLKVREKNVKDGNAMPEPEQGIPTSEFQQEVEKYLGTPGDVKLETPTAPKEEKAETPKAETPKAKEAKEAPKAEPLADLKDE